jgi:hypothetical protein
MGMVLSLMSGMVILDVKVTRETVRTVLAKTQVSKTTYCYFNLSHPLIFESPVNCNRRLAAWPPPDVTPVNLVDGIGPTVGSGGARDPPDGGTAIAGIGIPSKSAIIIMVPANLSRG